MDKSIEALAQLRTPKLLSVTTKLALNPFSFLVKQVYKTIRN
jgi:hypothetical protein